MPNEIGLWNKTPETPEGITAPTPETTVAPKRKTIRWSIFDALIALGLTLATQVVLSIAIIAIYLAKHSTDLASIDTNKITSDLTNGPVIVASSLLMYAVWFMSIWYASNKRGLKSYSKDFWLKFKPRDLWIGALVALGVRLAEFAVTNGLSALGVNMDGANNATSITDLTGFWFFAGAIVIASFMGPFMEEFLFRGLFLQALLRLFRSARITASRKSDEKMEYVGTLYRVLNVINGFLFKRRNILAALVTSAIFGSMHYQGFETFGQVFVVLWTGSLGFLLAMMVYRTKRLGPGIVAHILINLSGVLLAVIGS